MNQKLRIIMMKIKLMSLRKKLARGSRKMIGPTESIRWLIVRRRDVKLIIKIVKNKMNCQMVRK